MMQPFEPLAITGMDCAWGEHVGLDTFERLMYAGGQRFTRLEDGATVGKAPDVDALERVARRACQDAGLDGLDSAQMVTLLAGPTALQVHWPWAGRVIDLSGQPNPLAAALAQAQHLLNGGQVQVVLFAAVSGLPKPPSGDIAAPETSTAMGFDRSVHGWRFGEGAAAVVFVRQSQAAAGRKVYAVVRSLASCDSSAAVSSSTLPVPPALENVRGCCVSALEAAGVSPEQVGYIETFASGSDALDGVEIAGMAQAYRRPDSDLVTAFGSAQANLGYLGAASGLAGLVRAALCLYHREIPAVPGWSAPKLPALWKASPFYAPCESRAWFTNAKGPGRLAGLNVVGLHGAFAHLLLAESDRDTLHPNRALEQGGFFLMPIAGADLAGLMEALQGLRQTLDSSPDLTTLSAVQNEAAKAHSGVPYAAAIVGHTHEELMREVDLAIKAIPAAFEKRGEWQTPLGSYFTADPVGRMGDVSLVYPGAFNSFPGVAKDLFHLFPWLHLTPVGKTSDMGRAMRERLLYPRSLIAPSKEEQAAQEARLLNDAAAMLTSGTGVAILFTYILEEAFQIHPTSAFGYSLGENSMMFASGAWQEGDTAIERVEQSDAFQNRLAGPQNAVRDYWGLPRQSAPDPENMLWVNYLVMSSYENVVQAVAAEYPDGQARVYITHVNTPRQVVIGGDPAGCQRVIKALRCSSLQAPFHYALHCAPIASEVEELTGLHDCPIDHIPHLRLYTAADYEPLEIDRQIAARKIGHMLCTPLDFPRLVRRVYADGARVFIEAGAGSNCARWVDETLKGSPHLALSLNRRGTDDYSNLVRTLARLFSHRVPMDLSPLYVRQQKEDIYA